MKNENEIFVRVISESLAGALIGILAGAVLGLLIWGFLIPLNWLNHLLEPTQLVQMMSVQQQNIWPNASFPESLGMAFGAIIGSIMGGKAAFAKYKK
jgi:hypothetical protein